MANALPQAIGAQEAFPGRQVITLSGDGGFSMLMGDFLSLNQLKLPSRSSFSTTARSLSWNWKSNLLEFLTMGRILLDPDFAKMAEAVGILGLRAEDPDQVRPMLIQALTHDGPALVDVVVNRQELLIPPSINFEVVKGFSLYMLKAVLNGRGDEILDLAKTNLFR